MFKLSQNADTAGIIFRDEIVAVPAVVVKCFGPPARGNGFKKSGEYVFVDENDQPFVVHDWRATNLFDPDLPSPEEFWAGTEPQEFCVVARAEDTDAFERWFLGRLRAK
jgi:hypothetical protein